MKLVIKTFVIIIAGLTAFSASAYNEATYLIISSNLCTPVLVRCSNGQSYRIYDQVVVPGIVSVSSAIDCNGNRVIIPSGSSQSKTGEYHYRTYRFSMLYKSGMSQNQRSMTSSDDNMQRSIDRTATAIHNFGQGISQLSSYQDGEAYPGLHLMLGASKAFGEYAQLKVCSDGLALYAGIGKDWLWNGINNDKLLWHAGIGYYLGLGDYEDPTSDVTFGITVAQNAAWENLSLTFDVSYTYWIGHWKRFGVFGGAGFGIANLTKIGDGGTEFNGKWCWNVEAGIAIRLAHW